MIKENITNVVFDLGGVVLDWNPQKIKEEFRGNPKLPEVLFKIGFFQRNWTEFDRGMVTEAELLKQMEEASGFSEKECREFVDFVKHSLTDIPQTVRLIKDLSEKGYRLYCLSNMAVEFYDYLKGRAFFHYFDGQVISGLVKLVKPEKAIFQLLLERYDLKAKETLFVDDLEANIAAARQLGFQTVWFADRDRGLREIRELL